MARAETSAKTHKRRLIFNPRRLWKNSILVVIILVLFGPPVQAAWSVGQLAWVARSAKNSLKAHQVAPLSGDLNAAYGDTRGLHHALMWMPYWQWVPGVSALYHAAVHLSLAGTDGLEGIQTMWPSLDKLALNMGYGSGHPPLSGRERIAAVVKALPNLTPALQKADPSFQKANAQLSQVNVASLPGLVRVHAGLLAQVQQLTSTMVPQIPTMIRSSKVLMQVLGVPTQQRYLVFFQNSGELRPTGGFLTAYSLVTVHNGLVGSLAAHNIYSLASVVQYRPPAPPILHYVYTQHWHIRDANLSPNLPTTVGYINNFYNSIPNHKPINGMVFVDTWFVDQLLKDVGPITMPAQYHHIKITSQNANYEMEYIAERSGLPSNSRKAFIGLMMKDLIHRVLHSHSSTMAKVVHTVQQSLNQKLLMFYFNNSKAESFVNRYHWGGTMDTNVPGDYLSVVDANLGGHKDNYFMQYHVTTTITRQSNGQYQQTVTMQWTNPHVANGWLVVPYQSWLRVYTPNGSSLLGMSGDINGYTEVYTNNTVNKTVFGNHVSLPGRTSLSEPPAVGSMTVSYLLPAGTNMHTLTIQKQPGVRSEIFTVNMGSYHKTFNLTQDTVLHLPNN